MVHHGVTTTRISQLTYKQMSTSNYLMTQILHYNGSGWHVQHKVQYSAQYLLECSQGNWDGNWFSTIQFPMNTIFWGVTPRSLVNFYQTICFDGNEQDFKIQLNFYLHVSRQYLEHCRLPFSEIMKMTPTFIWMASEAVRF